MIISVTLLPAPSLSPKKSDIETPDVWAKMRAVGLS